MEINAEVFKTAWKETIQDEHKKVVKELTALDPKEELAKAVSGAMAALTTTLLRDPDMAAPSIRALFHGFFAVGRKVGRAEAEIEALKGMDAT